MNAHNFYCVHDTKNTFFVRPLVQPAIGKGFKHCSKLYHATSFYIDSIRAWRTNAFQGVLHAVRVTGEKKSISLLISIR